MKIKSKSALTISILIPIAVGLLSSFFSGSMKLYSTIRKPAFSPPGILFPIVWVILYTLMGISSYLIYSSGHTGRDRALRAYALQLAFNFFWSILFFGFSQYLVAFLWLLILIVLILIMIYRFYQISPPAAYLQIPYLLWCLFAACLNYGIYALN